ncbi:GH92 family glycosyl hydrolase [Pedobacter sp. MC2016-14]|uniref:GH92 family glycosyl hydrolase n=1 Tax=Pedobacter sp. MC2016-14 TaxID=2897327 RepID=UPI001E386CE7|nr:GH92 family glycosyl hydrolase [Pedobacter sp. MC2016-14]MCD0487326.1 GH92 family glycosyl hydrolase [Pedobacter sp. MC2016-14]
MKNSLHKRFMLALFSAATQRIFLFFLICLTSPVFVPGLVSLKAQDVVGYVQPLAGTAASTTAASLKHGDGTELNANTIPAVGLPFGMTQFTPQTRQSETKCQPPYFYKDNVLTGFRATHWLSGSCTQDYGSFTIMPMMGKLKTTPAGYGTPFSHQQETTAPNYYKVTLPAYELDAEFTATLRSGMMQFTAQRSDSLYVLIMPNSDQNKGYIQVDTKTGEVWGYNPAHRIYQGWGKPAGFSGYFYLKFEQQAATGGTFSEDKVFGASLIENRKDIGAYLGFKLNKGAVVCIRIGTSFSSLEGAKRNLEAEIKDWDFAALTARNKQVWQKALSQVKVETDVVKDKRIFYTALYHTMQHPRLFNDADGTYPRFSGNYQLKKLAKGNYYDDFSMWDIYRAQLPLFELLRPGLISDAVQSMVIKGEQGGWLPIFPCWNSYTAAMVGDHGTSFIASAYTKGIRGYDINSAYQLMRQNAFDMPGKEDYVNGKGRRALDSYLKYGYIPMEDSVPEAFHKKEQVSRTLEYAYNDYALAVVAKGLGKTADYETLWKRGQNYRNVFDPAVNMMRGRYIDKTWYAPFRGHTKEPYITEGTPQQYTFYVPQDVQGLANLMGGRKALEAALDTLFNGGEYWHGNEPGHQIPFMYNYTAAAWKTQLRVKEILADEYSDGPGGLSGNDDAGQMSAWYVFAAMGFYPLDPVSNNYILTAPLFKSTTIALPGAKTLKLLTRKKSKSSGYIYAVKWNGKVYEKNYLTYEKLMKGGRIEIFLQDEPNLNWGARPDDQPEEIKP